MSTTISACIIVRNEERVIRDALESILPWVDEVIIVDTGSTDKTVDIVKSFGITPHHFEWIDDFSAARNFSIQQAIGDWIVWMDADDEIPQETGSRLRLLASSAKDIVGGYQLNYIYPNSATGHMKGGAAIHRVALFRNKKEIQFRYKVHEVIDLSILDAGYELITTDLPIYHKNYSSDAAEIAKKNRRYLEIISKEFSADGNDIRHWHNVIMTHRSLHDYDAVMEYGDKFLLVAQSIKDPYGGHLSRIYAWIAEAYIVKKKFPEAIAILNTGLQKYPGNPDYLMSLGNAELALKHYDKAKAAALKITGSTYESVSDMGDKLNITFWPYQLLGFISIEEKNWLMAKNYLEYAQKVNPNTSTALLLLTVYKNMKLQGSYEELKQKILLHEPEAYEQFVVDSAESAV